MALVSGGNAPKVKLHPLRAKRLRLETQHEPLVIMHSGCPVAKSEGFSARVQIELSGGGRTALATLYQSADGLVALDQVGLSEVVWRRLGLSEGDEIKVRHPRPLHSMSAVRAKIYGHRLDGERLNEIVGDIVADRYSDVQLAAFLAGFAAQPASLEEMVSLTGAMVETGIKLDWPAPIVMDKHSVGGLPANRTTPIVVAIAAAAGLCMPKTSSRAITSPAGTADTMETMTNVDLDVNAIRDVVEREGGCLVWGGSVRLSPADDILIRVERALDLDSPAQLVASVLSKKIAAGATHVVLDLPVGPTAKVRTNDDAEEISNALSKVASAFGLIAKPLISDGSQPVGRGIGPALEARDVLAVLRCEPKAPRDLRERALALAAAVLEIGGAAPQEQGARVAEAILDNGRAYSKFMAICEAQGGFREPTVAPLRRALTAPSPGLVSNIDNRLLARLAKLAGAPRSRSAGVELHVKIGDSIMSGDPLITVHGESPGELDYALAFAAASPAVIEVRAP